MNAEKALKESEEKFRMLAECTSAGIVVIQGTKIRYANPAAEELTGYTKEEILAMDFWDFFHPDFRELVKEAGLADQGRQIGFSDNEVRIVTKRGEERWWRIMGGRIEYEGNPAVIGTAHDVTDLKRAEESLRESEEMFRTFSEAARDAIFMMDDEGNITFWNRGAERLFGYSSREVLGKEGHLFIAPERDHGAYRRGFRGFVESGKGPLVGKTTEVTALKKDGTEFPVELSVSAIKLKGRWHATGIARDITERKDMEKALKEALERALEASRVKSEFLANMSHELTTPLNSVIGFSEVLLDGFFGELNPKQREYAGTILSSGRHLLETISDILEFAKLDVEKGKPVPERFFLRDLLGSSASVFRERALEHGIQLSLEVENGADAEMEADAARLKRIMYNLLSNAVKFTPNGGAVSVRARRVSGSGFRVSGFNSKLETQNSKPDADFVEISVADTGIGIGLEEMPRLFTPFSQLESPFTKRYEGMGMGLALAKRLVELLGGHIWVESELGRGSKFTFAIPVGH